MELIELVEDLIEEVRREFIPDPRLEVFDIRVFANRSGLLLVGSTSEPAAAEAIHQRVAVLDAGVQVRDEVERLPRPDEGNRSHALVVASVAPLLAGPLVSETMISQALLGHRLLVLRERGRWLQCRAPDGYLGWVHRGYVRRVDDVDATLWEVGAPGEPCFSLGAEVRGPDGEVLARLPWGSRVALEPDGIVHLPDGSRGEAVGELVPLAQLPLRFPADAEAVVATAARWIGAPYLWGGLTPTGVDCSGLVQAVYRTHGVRLPRDSDQQARIGQGVEPGASFEALRPGDLLFFAEEPERISHVALSLGGPRILHSSLGNGGVRRNDLTAGAPYEAELRRLFVCARRPDLGRDP